MLKGIEVRTFFLTNTTKSYSCSRMAAQGHTRRLDTPSRRERRRRHDTPSPSPERHHHRRTSISHKRPRTVAPEDADRNHRQPTASGIRPRSRPSRSCSSSSQGSRTRPTRSTSRSRESSRHEDKKKAKNSSSKKRSRSKDTRKEKKKSCRRSSKKSASSARDRREYSDDSSEEEDQRRLAADGKDGKKNTDLLTAAETDRETQDDARPDSAATQQPQGINSETKVPADPEATEHSTENSTKTAAAATTTTTTTTACSVTSTSMTTVVGEAAGSTNIPVDEDAPTPPASAKQTTTVSMTTTALDEDALTPPGSPTRTAALNTPAYVHQPDSEVVPAGVGKGSFFAQLRAMEQRKGSLGTIHATGGRGAGGATAGAVEGIKSNDWECQKCGKSNYKNASACDRLVKRIEAKGETSLGRSMKTWTAHSTKSSAVNFCHVTPPLELKSVGRIRADHRLRPRAECFGVKSLNVLYLDLGSFSSRA